MKNGSNELAKWVIFNGVLLGGSPAAQLLRWPITRLQEPTGPRTYAVAATASLECKRFDVITDHQALLFFMTKRLPNARQARWTGHLSNYNFAVQYRPDHEHVLADALSRKAEGLLTQKDINNASRKEVLLKSILLSSPEVLEELGQMLIAVRQSLLSALLCHAMEPSRARAPTSVFFLLYLSIN
ncbi:reverse transcriptase domain protein [Colletotrichum chrysophilum]|uniref:Reverse transcriptase domain protein n=1 Tax=Colletotrichum chrysophilum TaxID=1836956 RepID=A0AAD9B260_9PEZI|nr:reverse transcriptase domain protein [Colletotrichum chrysophilum]